MTVSFLTDMLKHKRQPETLLFTRPGRKDAVVFSVCAYNHLFEELSKEILYKQKSIYNEETGISFRNIDRGPCFNSNTADSIRMRLAELNGSEYIGTCVHEQYFYPDCEEKFFVLGKTLNEYGYRFITADEMK